MSLPTACRHTLCPAITTDPYCEKHQQEDTRERWNRWAERTGYEATSPRERGYTTRWDKVSKAYRAAHPLCEICLRAGKTTATEAVDHIVPIIDGGAKYDWDNLQSACTPCNSRKSMRDRARRA